MAATPLEGLGPPQNVLARALDFQTVRIVWDAAAGTAGARIQDGRYTVVVLSRGGTLVGSYVNPLNTHFVDVTGLKSGLNYKATVSVAIGSVIKSSSSDEFQTLGPDLWQLMALAPSDGTVTVKWTVPDEFVDADRRAVLTATLVEEEYSRHQRLARSLSTVSTPPIPIAAGTAVLDELLAASLYAVVLSILYPGGATNMSLAYAVTLEEAPSPARNLTVIPGSDPVIAFLYWDPPLSPNGLVGYLVSYSRNSSLQCSIPHKRTLNVGTSTQYTLIDLKPYESYTIEVSAYNVLFNLSQVGEGIDTKKIFKTAPSRLDAPITVEADSLSSGAIVVGWKDPECINGEAIGVQVFYAPQVVVTGTSYFPMVFSHSLPLVDSVSGNYSYTLESGNLFRNTTYAIWLRYVDMSEPGFASSHVYALSILKGPDGELGSLKAFDETMNSVVLTWLRPPDSMLNDDSGNFLYRIRFETNESRAGEQQNGLFDYYPSPRSSAKHWDEYKVTSLVPYARYDLCVSLATFAPSAGLLEGEENCTMALTNSSAPSKDAIEFELDGCPYLGWNSSFVVVQWDVHLDQQPGLIDDLFLRYLASEQVLAAVLVCPGRDAQAAVCDDVSESEWCEWRLEDMDGYCNVTGLDAYTIYQFEIKALNVKGTAEVQRETQTCADVPSQPVPLYCELVSNGSYANLLWTVGRKNSPSVNYTVIWNIEANSQVFSFQLDTQLQPFHDDPISCSLDVSKTASCTIRNVSVDESHRFSAIATNEMGSVASIRDAVCQSYVTESSKSNEVVIAAPIVGIVVLLIVAVTVIFLFYLYRWKPARQLKTELDDDQLRAVELRRKSLDMCGHKNKIGGGAFGNVYMGWVKSDQGSDRVAIKELKEGVGTNVKVDFIREAKLTLAVEHSNVVKLLYVCTEDEPYVMVMEYINQGSLCSLLRLMSPDGHDHLCEFTALKGDIIYQVATGLAAVSEQNIIHRDIAARNCLVHDTGNSFTIKIADFGLAVRVSDEFGEVRLKTPGSILPFWWMSPEAAYDRRYSEKSDVWSYGVLCWEVYSCGETPYKNFTPMDARRYISHHLPLPLLPFHLKTETGTSFVLPYEVQKLLYACWSLNVDQRPSFEDITEEVRKFVQRDATKLMDDISVIRQRSAVGLLDSYEGSTAL